MQTRKQQSGTIEFANNAASLVLAQWLRCRQWLLFIRRYVIKGLSRQEKSPFCHAGHRHERYFLRYFFSYRRAYSFLFPHNGPENSFPTYDIPPFSAISVTHSIRPSPTSHVRRLPHYRPAVGPVDAPTREPADPYNHHTPSRLCTRFHPNDCPLGGRC